MNDSKILRWGIMGCARISRRGLVPGILGSRSGRLQAIASRDLTRAQAWAREFTIPKAHGSYEALLADPEIDAVYIPLPNELHLPWVIAAAAQGKHILCEKPLALNDLEAKRMVESCAANDVVLMEAFMWRHQPRTLGLRELARSGKIGEPRLIRASFSFPITPGDWRLDLARGGGALWDVGCYGVNTARLFAGREPIRVKSVAHFGETGVDLTLCATLDFGAGLVATIDCSFEQPFCCRYELVGTLGTIEVPDAYLPPVDSPALARVRMLRLDSSPGFGDYRDETLAFEPINQYAAMVDAFAESVAAGALVDPAEDGVAQTRLLGQILADAAQ